MSRKVHAGFGRGVSEKGREVPRRHPTSATCHPFAIERRWTRERVLAAMTEWRSRYGKLPTSYDWSSTHARGRGGEALARVAQGEWPAGSVATRLFGAWSAARAVAAQRAEEITMGPASARLVIWQGLVSLPKPRGFVRRGAAGDQGHGTQVLGRGVGIPSIFSPMKSLQLHGWCPQFGVKGLRLGDGRRRRGRAGGMPGKCGFRWGEQSGPRWPPCPIPA